MLMLCLEDHPREAGVCHPREASVCHPREAGVCPAMFVLRRRLHLPPCRLNQVTAAVVPPCLLLYPPQLVRLMQIVGDFIHSCKLTQNGSNGELACKQMLIAYKSSTIAVVLRVSFTAPIVYSGMRGGRIMNAVHQSRMLTM